MWQTNSKGFLSPELETNITVLAQNHHVMQFLKAQELGPEKMADLIVSLLICCTNQNKNACADPDPPCLATAVL